MDRLNWQTSLPEAPGRSCQNQTVVPPRHHDALGDALDRLADALENLDAGPELAPLRADRDRLARSIRSHLIPRARHPETPITVVFAGPTGSGKSTLINSLTGLDLSVTGVIRPTTTGPVALVAERHVDDHRHIGGVECEVTLGEAPILETMVLVDTPDIDSTALEHRAMAEILIDNADVVVFVTSALRYADAVPWQVLRRAAARGTDVIPVLNRVGSTTSGAVIDFRSRLSRAGLGDYLITVSEHHLPEDRQRVPSISVRPLRRRLAMIAVRRDEYAAAGFDRALQAVVGQVADLARQVDGLNQEDEGIEAELSLHATDRAVTLDLGEVADGLLTPTPETPGRGALRRWAKANHLTTRQVRAAERRIIERLTAIVQVDIRRWILAEGGFAGLTQDIVAPQLSPVLRSAIEGWVLFVRRIAEEVSGQDDWPAEAMLFQASLAGEIPASVAQIFGDGAVAAVERARRELLGRLDVVYEQAVDQLLELSRRDRGSLDDSDLKAALGAVTSTLAPVHA